MKLIKQLSLITFCILTLLSCKESDKTYSKKQLTELDKSITRGQKVYVSFCITCHSANGEGVPRVFPPLANSDYLKNNREESIRGVKYGQKGEIVVNDVTYNSFMPPMGLTDTEVADVMNFINHYWGNDYGEIVTPQEVTKITK